MLRALGHLLLVLLPFAAYGLYIALARKGAIAAGRDTPWIKLAIVGLALFILSFVVSVMIGGNEPGGTYVPARLEDGRIVPPQVR